MWGCSQDALVKPIACGAAAKMLDQDFANSLNGIYIDDLYPDSIQAPPPPAQALALSSA